MGGYMKKFEDAVPCVLRLVVIHNLNDKLDYKIMNQNLKANKYLPSAEAKIKYKKQSLKPKNILFENESIQIGCKVTPFYDFYSSKNFLMIQIFVGNKTQKKIQNFSIHYKGTPNLELYL